MVAEFSGGAWNLLPVGNLADGVGSSVSLAVAQDGRALATWSQFGPNNTSATYLAWRSPLGDWTLPGDGEAFSFSDRASESLPFILPSGESFVVWNQGTRNGEERGYGVALARQAPGEPFGTFTFPRGADDVLSPGILFSNAPQLAVASNGDALVTWYQSVGDGLSIFVSERDGEHGEFSRPGPSAKISPDGGRVADHRVRNPVVAIGPRGAGMVVWSQFHPSGKIGLYAAERDGLRRWTLPTGIDDTFAPLREHATCAEVLMTESEETFVVWFDGAPGNTQVYVAHRNDAGEWDSPRPTGTRLSSPNIPAYAPRIAAGGDGEVVAAWTELQDGVWTVVGRRRNPRATEWSALERLSDPAKGDAIAPVVGISAAGHVVVAWEQGSFEERQIFVAMEETPPD